MKICTKCNVKILDDTDRCPLCSHALAGDEGGMRTYPDAVGSIRKARVLENLVLFMSLIAGTIVVAVNMTLDRHFLWSFIVVLALVYINIMLRYAILGRSDYHAKTFGMWGLALVVLLMIDFLTGFQRWSLTYAFPAALIALDLGTVVLMIVNRRNWQSYILHQLTMFLLSLVSIIFIVTGLDSKPVVAIVAIGVTFFLFAGTVILGDERARQELKRRFHI